jgi:hypothetical protein
MVQVSLFASAVRPKLWKVLVDSLGLGLNDREIVFAGNAEFDDRLFDGKICKYIKTGNIKPAQCYEIARRACTGETVVWIADDCEFPNDVIGKAYKYWKEQNNEKLILSIQTKESGYGNPQGSLFNMDIHRFFGGDRNSPLMAPLALMSRRFLDELQGIDRRYVCGQYENDIVMRAYAQGAKVEIFGGADCYIDIDHLGKSILIGESKGESDFRARPFATGYEHDRQILQGSWCTLDKVRLTGLLAMGATEIHPSYIYTISPTQLDKFEPYAENISLTESESYKGKWE